MKDTKLKDAHTAPRLCDGCGRSSIGREMDISEVEELGLQLPDMEERESAYLCVFCQGLADKDTFGQDEYTEYFENEEDDPMPEL